MHKSNFSTKLLELRVIVSFLGEKKQAGWWQSDFWSPTASVFLSPIFPRTVFLSQAEGAAAAARLIHDNRIGVGKVFHLFRLPESIEQSIHESLQNPDVSQRLFPLVKSRDSALEYLYEKFGKPVDENPVGPVLCGNVDAISNVKTISRMAGAYRSGFQRAVEVFPYLKEIE